MKKIGIFTSKESDWNVVQLRNEIEKRRIECVCFPITDFVVKLAERPYVTCRGHSLEDFDALIVRWIPGGSAEQIIFRMDVLHRLENLGIKVLNPAIAIERCADKFYTCSLLEDAGISVPRTIVAENYRDALNAFLKFKDVVVKPLFGSLGVGMLRVDNGDLAYRVFKALEFGRSIYYVQEFIPHDHDVRAFVVGDEVIASMKRVGSTWKTNISRGAKACSYELSQELKEICVKTANIIGCEYAGVDLIEHDDKNYVIEVNSMPGWKGLQSVTSINIAERIIEHLLKWK